MDAARDLLRGQNRLARKALAAASRMLPFNASVRQARERIESLEHGVFAAYTQAEVARDFLDFLAVPDDDEEYELLNQPEVDGSLMIVAHRDLDSSAVRVSGGNNRDCDYTVGDIIILLLGFIFFIIPGIIFLSIFC